ncbi:YhcN/YlaJ family sporulation lipoprotein [Alkalicoccobacillus porphyridii]|uniref:YhcN/YlaJ family sporulation lipoprotein n=1 Tax=Alkalicoccobacillus porphyridii TaxID=2597270 RepID=A0A554A4B0_9BACI|nr:YhcN/YlaJ family sporulation lipoprotein [Alkalicoccobacillus porphyridii]TSB48529.1 YhcN/YlaJ family sporulation lipoprotein [Alkalicoccobacillus porphyridii]
MNYLKSISMLCLVSIMLVGCGMNNDNNGENTAQNYDQQPMGQDENRNMNRADNHDEGYVHDEVKQKVDEIDGVRTSHVVVVGNDAYVAVMLDNDNNNQEEIPKDLKEKVSDKVKEEDPSISAVYVSSNPDFLGHMQNYSDRLQQGEPFTGLYDEFAEMTKRVFPDRQER